MNIFELKAGDVFTWENYPLADNIKSRRWFVFLGYNHLNAIYYEVTATTQLQYYTENGSRARNSYLRIPSGIGGLPEDSIIDIDQWFEDLPEGVMKQYKNDIAKQGRLPKEYISKLEKCVNESRRLPKIIKKDINMYLQESLKANL